MYNTYVRPARDLRNNYADVIRMLNEHNQVIITNKGKGEAVLIKIEDYAGYEEYLHTRYIKEKIDEVEKQKASGEIKWYSWEEVMEEFSEGL